MPVERPKYGIFPPYDQILNNVYTSQITHLSHAQSLVFFYDDLEP